MATGVAVTETDQGAATGGTDSGQAPEPLFGERERCRAREKYPRLYSQITEEESVSFDHIIKAWGIRHNRAEPEGKRKRENRVSLFLEHEARIRFAIEHGPIEREYWSPEAEAGCALTSDGCVHSAMNTTDPDLVLYEDRVHQLSRDARRAFGDPHRIFGDADCPSERPCLKVKAKKDLKETGEMLYVVLARTIVAASVVARNEPQDEKDDAFDALRVEWKTAHASVEKMIQRQARFEYFTGVLWGALFTILLLAGATCLAVRYGADQLSEPGESGSLTAATIGGAIGAVISVTQRMTIKTRTPLVIDFTAPKLQKMVLGGLRPIMGAVFGAVVYFAIVGGLVVLHAKTDQDASVAVAFFAVAGFAAGFSERFATDLVNHATSGILPAARDKEDAENTGEPSHLLSRQSRHPKTPTVTQDHQANAPKKTTGEKGEDGPQPGEHAPQPPAPGQEST